MVEAIDAHRRADTPERRAARARAQILSLAQSRLHNHPDLDRLAADVATGAGDPYSAAAALLSAPVTSQEIIGEVGGANGASEVLTQRE